MTLQIIGAGFGRTGTSSVRSALEQLGFSCYHMTEVMFNHANKAHVDFWQGLADAPDRDDLNWSQVFSRYTAVLDFPACTAWRRLMSDFPQAKVLMTLHPKGAEAWYDSCYSTIYVGTELDAATPFGRKFNTMMDDLVWNGLLQGTMAHKEQAIALYEAHLEEVQATVPAERLLVFSADQGWEPLCRFLEMDVPDAPFPNVNNQAEMSRVMTRLNRLAAMRKSSG